MAGSLFLHTVSLDKLTSHGVTLSLRGIADGVETRVNLLQLTASAHLVETILSV